jgi:hypothetical protein
MASAGGSLKAGDVSVRTSIVPPGPACHGRHAGHITRCYETAAHNPYFTTLPYPWVSSGLIQYKPNEVKVVMSTSIMTLIIAVVGVVGTLSASVVSHGCRFVRAVRNLKCSVRSEMMNATMNSNKSFWRANGAAILRFYRS